MANFQQVIKGGTIGPGANFPEHCYFEGVTILATCTFGEGSIFKNCKFQRCCPKPNTNQPSKVTKSIVENCTLESVSLDNETLSHNNTSTGYMVQDMSNKNVNPRTFGATEPLALTWCHNTPTEQVPCPQSGVVVFTNEKGTPEVNPPVNLDCSDPCNITAVYGSGKDKVRSS